MPGKNDKDTKVSRKTRAGSKTGTESAFSGIEMENWRDYPHILTDSLWLLGKRDRTGAHTGDYHGNFVPQIPQQLIERYTKAGEWVIDPFSGSGTTLIEAQRMARNCAGIELNPEMARDAMRRVKSESSGSDVSIENLCGDSASEKTWIKAAKLTPGGEFHLAILHPPYHDIIKFSGDNRCLSNKASEEDFLDAFGSVLEHTYAYLASGRFAAIVIGDKYAGGEWIPLGFMCMQRAIETGFKLKSIVIKDMQDNRAKRNQENLWRVRALRGGFYIFKHEYILIMRKN